MEAPRDSKTWGILAAVAVGLAERSAHPRRPAGAGFRVLRGGGIALPRAQHRLALLCHTAIVRERRASMVTIG